MTLVEAPAVIVGTRDAEWLATVVRYVLPSLAGTPALHARALEVLDELDTVARFAATRGQPLLVANNDGDALVVNYATAARRLDVSERTIRRLVQSGRLQAVEILGARRIPSADLARFVEAVNE